MATHLSGYARSGVTRADQQHVLRALSRVPGSAGALRQQPPGEPRSAHGDERENTLDERDGAREASHRVDDESAGEENHRSDRDRGGQGLQIDNGHTAPTFAVQLEDVLEYPLQGDTGNRIDEQYW
jgi:hypothetical protein